MKRVHFLYAGLCFCVSLAAAGQPTASPPSHHLELSPGLTFHQVKDDALSPVRYRGLLPTLFLGWLKDKPGRKLVEWQLPVQFADLRSRQANAYVSRKATTFRFDLDYVHLRELLPAKETRAGAFYLGGSLHTFLALRYAPQLDNSAIVYDHFYSLAVSSAYRRSFQLGNKTLLHYHRVSLPLLSYGTRPDYMNTFELIEPGGNNPLRDAYRRARVCGFGSFARVMIRNSLFYPIRSGNRLGLTYEWQAYGASFAVPVRAASHTLRFSLLINL